MKRLAKQFYTPARGSDEREEHSDAGALAGAVRPQETEHLTARHGEIQLVHRPAVLEAFAEIDRLEDRLGGHRASGIEKAGGRIERNLKNRKSGETEGRINNEEGRKI
jgi:hypothetical protein